MISMRRRYGHALLLGAAIAMVLAIIAAPAMAQDDSEQVVLKMGDKAPEWSMVGSDGKTYTLSQFKGKSPVIMAFFPKAFTPG